MTHVDALHLTMGEAIDRLQPPAAPKRNDMASARSGASQSWDLGAGYEQAVTLAEFGWKREIPGLEGYLATVQQLVRGSWSTHLDVSGECVDIGAYLEGEPECMLNFVTPESRAIRIVANMSARCDADAPRLLNRGIAIAAAVYALQCSGVAVSLTAGEWVTGGGRVHETLIEINPFGDYIDAGRLAFWLGHPAALRRCFFRFQEQQPSEVRDRFGFHSGGGYGSPSDPPKDSAAIKDAIFIPYPQTEELGKYESPARAFATIHEILARQGVDLSVRV